MASINNTPRPAYVYDTATNEWIPIGVGAHSHNEIPKTVVDAKGDLIVGTAADEVNRLAVGSNGYTLVADSSTSTGLAYSPTFFAGKNKILNSDFSIAQRGTSFSNPANNAYTLDRWMVKYDGTGATRTISQQTFTPGTAPVAGYEGSNFIRWNVSAAGTGNTYSNLTQRIEDVRTFANQTITISFWAKADTTRTLSYQMWQNFGSGGSATVGYGGNSSTLSTSWQRFSYQTTLSSIAGKTIGTSSYLEFEFIIPSNTTETIDIWGVQIESGSTVTSFQTATGTIQAELTACQRYYEKSFAIATQPAQNVGNSDGAAIMPLTTDYAQFYIPFRVTKRAAPTITLYNPNAANALARNLDDSADMATTSSRFIGEGSFSVVAAKNAAGNTGDVIGVHWVASIEL